MRLASRLSSSPTPTTARPDGVARMPSGGWVFSRTARTIGARSSSEPGPVRNTMLNALPSSLTVATWMSLGATSYAARTSAPVGAMSLAPGTSSRSPMDVSMLDADTTRCSGVYRLSVSRVNECTNEMNRSEKTSPAVAYTPISLDECTSSSTVWMSWIVPELWLTHWTGSVCNMSLFSTLMPTTKIVTLNTTSASALAAGSEPSHTTSRPSTPSR